MASADRNGLTTDDTRAAPARQQHSADLAALRALDPAALVELLHPSDALSGEHTTAAAGQAAALVRYLAHALQGSDAARAVPDPRTAGDLIAAATLVTARLAQVLEHLAARTRRLAQDPRVDVDATGRQHGDPHTVAELAAINLESAAGRLNQASTLQRTASGYTDTFTLDEPDEPGHDHG
jgi:hypothetical protein